MYIDGCRSGAGSESNAARRRALLRARRLPRRRARRCGADGGGRQSARRHGAPATRRRAAQARREGMRLRAGAAVRDLPAHALPSLEEASRRRDRRFRAARAMGLLLRQTRSAQGAVGMAELTHIRETVREKYAAAARAAAEPESDSAQAGCCGSSRLSGSPADSSGLFGRTLYDETAGAEVPQAALNASLGCGVPTAVADLEEGETVLDLGSGAGADVLISARRVGPAGKAIGLDMTEEMLELARANATEAGLQNVEFLKGYLEDMPLDDASVDVVISNCVINLSADKRKVLR